MLIAGQKPPAGANSDGKGNDVRENVHPGVGAIEYVDKNYYGTSLRCCVGCGDIVSIAMSPL